MGQVSLEKAFIGEKGDCRRPGPFIDSADTNRIGLWADEAGFVAAGYIDVRAESRAVATSNGLFAFQPGTGVASTLTVRTPGS